MKSEIEELPGRAKGPMTRRTTGLSIVADDLTGACDAAVAFTRCMPDVRVELEPSEPQPESSPKPAVRACCTYTRDLAAHEADLHLCRAFKALPAGDEVLKKIDSVFRGNTFVEISAALRLLPYDLAVIAPSYPVLNRRLSMGVLHVADIADERRLPVSETLVSETLAAYGHRHHGLAAGLSGPELLGRLREALSTAHRTVLCDAAKQDDLDRVVRAARTLGLRTLWIGSGGLAHALAAERSSVNVLERPQRVEARRPARMGRVAYLVGSHHAVTQAQVEHLRERIAQDEKGAETPHHDPLLVEVVRNRTTEAEIREALTAESSGDIGCLFITGGDTARLVCRALGIVALRLEGEITPGVCFGQAEGGPFDGIHVVLKSGGFGERDLLCRVLERFGSKKGMKA